MNATVILADDHAAMVETVSATLAKHGFDVVAKVYDGERLLAAAAQHDPDLLVVDISMPRLGGVAALRALKDRGCRSGAVMFTVHEDPDLVVEAQRAGARGFVIKNRMATDLIPAMREVLAGGEFVSPPMRNRSGE